MSFAQEMRDLADKAKIEHRKAAILKRTNRFESVLGTLNSTIEWAAKEGKRAVRITTFHCGASWFWWGSPLAFDDIQENELRYANRIMEALKEMKIEVSLTRTSNYFDEWTITARW